MRKGRKREQAKALRQKAESTPAAGEPVVVAAPNAALDPVALRWKCLVVLFLVVVVLVPYGQVLGFDFVDFDDYQYVKENPKVSAGLTPENVAWAFTTGELSNWHPLTWLSYLLDAQIFGVKNAAPFHVVNVLFHAVNSALLFLLLCRMTGALWPSMFAAALFAVHPLHVESVAWIAERKDVLSTFFGLLTMMAYARYVASPGLRYLPVAVFFALGLMAKPMLVTLPAVLLLMDYWPLRRLEGVGSAPGQIYARWRWLVIEKAPLFALALASSVATVFAQGMGHSVMELERLPLWARVANAIVAYGQYIATTVVPKGLAVFYPHPGLHVQAWQVLLAGGFLVAASVFVVRRRKSNPYLLVGWLWYLGTLVPVIGLIQVGEQARADRYTYVPLIGLFIAAAWGIRDLAARYRIPKKALGLGGAALLIALTASTGVQASNWHDTRSLFEHALRVTSSNYTVHKLLGLALASEGSLDEAEAHYQKAMELKPDFVEAHNDLGAALLRQKRFDEAKVQFLKTLELRPDFVDAHYNLGLVLLRQEHFDEAQVHFLKALEDNSDSIDAHNNLGIALAGQGRFDEAQVHFLKVLALKPDFADAHDNLGKVLLAEGHSEEATAHFQKAIELNPDFADARFNLGMLCLEQKRYDEAKAYLTKTLELNPEHVEALNNLSKLDLDQGRYDEAKAHLMKAVELNPKNVGALNMLGCCLVNQEQYEEAQRYFRKAIETDPKFIDAMNNLGVALAKLGRQGEADGYFKRAADLKNAVSTK